MTSRSSRGWTRGWERDDPVVTAQLAHRPPPVSPPPDEFDVAKDEGQARQVARLEVRPVLRLEVQVGLRRVPRVAATRDRLAPAHPLTLGHQDAPLHEVRQEHPPPSAHLDDDMIADDL